MRTSPGLFALTRRRFATPRSAAAVIVVLTLLAAFVIAAAPRALVGIVRDEVAHQIDGVPATSRDMTALAAGVPQAGPALDASLTEGWDDGASEAFGEVAQALADNYGSFDAELRELVGPAQFAMTSSATPADPQDLPATSPSSEIQPISEPALSAAATLVEGVWPAAWDGVGLIEIVLTADAAATMVWPVGEVRGTLTDPPVSGEWAPGTPRWVLVGTVDPVDADADRWLHLPTALTATVFDDGNRRPTATSAAWVHPATWDAFAHQHAWRPNVTAWYPVDGAGAIAADPRDLLTSLRGATSSSVPFDSTGQMRATFDTEIVSVLATALARADSASAILAVAAVGPLAVSVALVVLAGTLIVRRRRGDLALMSARGAPISRLRRLLLVEGLILGVAPAAIAAAVGVLVTPHDAGWLPTAVAVAVGFAPAIALASAVRPDTIGRGRADLDAPRRSRAATIVSIIVILLAVLAVLQLVLRGVGPATDGIDPIVVVAPLLATVALALIMVRLHPLPLAAALAAARRSKGVVALVGAARSLRDPAAGTTAVLAMLVAVAIAVFSSVVLATVDRGAEVAAQRTVGADIQLSGPYFTTDTIDELRQVEGVVDAVGVLRGEYQPISGSDGRTSALVLVTETERLAAIQRGMVGAIPSGAVTPGSDPIQMIESTALADSIGTGSATIAEHPAEVVATVDRLLGMTVSTQFSLIDVVDDAAIRGAGFFPRNVFVDIVDGADPEVVAAALGDVIGASHSVRLLEESTAEIQASPAVTALRTVLFLALGVAVALSVVAVLLVAGVSQDSRSRLIALLRSMGLDRRRARGVVAWEFAPLGVTAIIGGVILGIVLPLLVVLSIDLRPFTGGGAQPQLVVDPVLSAALILIVVAALALAVLAGVIGARTTSMATVLRTEED